MPGDAVGVVPLPDPPPEVEACVVGVVPPPLLLPPHDANVRVNNKTKTKVTPMSRDLAIISVVKALPFRGDDSGVRLVGKSEGVGFILSPPPYEA